MRYLLPPDGALKLFLKKFCAYSDGKGNNVYGDRVVFVLHWLVQVKIGCLVVGGNGTGKGGRHALR